MTFRLPRALLDQDLGRATHYLEEYFHSGRYTGALFDVWSSGGRSPASSPNQFTADDLVALSLLSVHVPGEAALALLAPDDGNPFNALLRDIGDDRELAEEPEVPSPSQAAWVLDKRLRNLPGVGRTIASKLMARKRPRLVPIIDDVVNRVMSLTPEHWVPLHAALRADAGRLQHQLVALHERCRLPREISALRVLDVVAWMEGKAAR